MTSRARAHFLLSVLGAIAFCVSTDFAVAQVHVRGYYRKDGTYVRPHYRSNPDGVFENNWSTKGNINPYTGEWGTRVTPPSRYRSSYSRRPNSSGYYFLNTPDYDGPALIENPNYRARPIPSPQTPARNAEDDRIRDVASFDYHGVGFATTHTEFLRRYPLARPSGQPTPGDVVSYAMDDLDRQRDAVWFQFLDDDLLCLGFTYDAPLVRRYGGASTLLIHAKLRFGDPAEEDEAVTIWRYPTVDRTVRAGWSGDHWCLLVSRDSVQERARRSTSDVGRVEESSRTDDDVSVGPDARATTSDSTIPALEQVQQATQGSRES